MDKKLILMVEDDENLRDSTVLMLETEGYAVETAITLAEAREILEKRMPAAIILDRNMPDGDGITLLAELRKTSRVPVLILTGLKEQAEVREGYDSGCDDYMKKPFFYEELQLKLQSLLRRAEQIPETITKGGLTLNISAQMAYKDGEDLSLSPNEYKLLQFLIQNEGRVMSSEYIYESVWGQPMIGDTTALRVAASNLRKKLTGSGYTVTKSHGTGYCFERGEP